MKFILRPLSPPIPDDRTYYSLKMADTTWGSTVKYTSVTYNTWHISHLHTHTYTHNHNFLKALKLPPITLGWFHPFRKWKWCACVVCKTVQSWNHSTIRRIIANSFQNQSPHSKRASKAYYLPMDKVQQQKCYRAKLEFEIQQQQKNQLYYLTECTAVDKYANTHRKKRTR